MTAQAVPTTLQPYFDKGLQAYTQGSYEYAIDLLTYVIKHAPDATEARRYLRLAIQKLYSQHPPSWIAQLGTAVAAMPVRLWGDLVAAQGKHQQAIQIYERVLCLQPRSRGALLRLAGSLNKAGMDEAAEAAYLEILSFDPNYPAALRKLARLSMKRGHDERARQCFEKILTLTPNDVEAQQGVRNLDALGAIKKGFAA